MDIKACYIFPGMARALSMVTLPGYKMGLLGIDCRDGRLHRVLIMDKGSWKMGNRT